MIIAGQLLLEEEGAACAVRLVPGWVRVEDEVIAEVVEVANLEEIPANADVGGKDYLISPGLIDTHVHLPQFDMIGAHGLPLLDWLSGVTFPAESQWADADYAAGMTRRVAEQFFANGTTGICAYSSVHHKATATAIRTLDELGMRGVVGQAMSNRFAPETLCGETNKLLEETADLLTQFPAEGRVAAAITPRFAVSCTFDLLKGAGQLAKEHPAALVQTHLSETKQECELVGELFGGLSYVEAYRQAGLVTDRSLFGHGIYLSDAERQILQEARSVITHCPTANSFLRSGAMDRHALLESGVRIALGSDIGGGYERSMVRVARAMVETASALGDHYPAASEAWWQITAGAAEAVGWSDAGRLREGNPADLFIVKPNIPWLSQQVDPLAMLLFAWDDRWTHRVFTRGEVAFASDEGK